LPKSGADLGCFDIRYAYAYQLFELLLTAEQTEAVINEGVALRTEDSGNPLWIFDELDGNEDLQFFSPHLYVGNGGDPIEQYVSRMASAASLQPFGWLEGCVLDGLYDLRRVIDSKRMQSAIDLHLEQFLDEQGELSYVDLRGREVTGTFTTIEATLPVGVIAKLYPNHPLAARAISYWDSCSEQTGGYIIDGNTVSAEGTYTVAYPLAAIASRSGRQDLAELAIRQVLLRRDLLADGPHVYLRCHRVSGERTFRNWSRAYAWYMLGLVRTWLELNDSEFSGLPGLNDIEEELRRTAETVLNWKGKEALWTCFLDDPATGVETSGSAGIAAALVLGARAGLLPAECLAAGERGLEELLNYLTPDGFLTGVSQHNAGGMELQQSGYRVLSQMGMGLLAQLYAAVKS
jgi:rhamnogalacturonyl hydrolase YesR